MRLMFGCGAGLLWLASASMALAEPADPAQVIAHKFWLANQPKETSTEAKPAPAAPTGAVKAAQSQPASPDTDYENDMLRRAREEQAERAVKSNAAKPMPSPAPTPAAEPEAAATPPASPGKSAAAPEAAAPLPLITPPEASKTAATPKIEAVAPPAAPPPAPPAVATKALPPPTTAAPLAAAPVAAPASPAAAPQPKSPLPEKAAEAPKPLTGVRATVLLAIDTLDARQRETKFLPDPIVCIDGTCYLSGGLSKAASAMARSDALALKGTEEKAPDGCRGMFGCIYRGVTVPDDSRITVVDLSLAGNGDTGAYSIAADKSCRKDEDELICENGLMTQTYRVWIVPEATAEAAGTRLLEDAVAEGLTSGDIARASDK